MQGPQGGTASVGIVTRTRDRPVFVVRALHSVLAQTYPHWHLVLVNDGGDPAPLRAALDQGGLAARMGGRLTVLNHPASVGRATAFNRGLAALDSDFVACLDDDDSWSPDFLAELVAFFQRNMPLMPDLGGVAAGVTALREELVTDPDGQPRILPLGEDSLPQAFRRSDFLLGPIAYAAYRHDLYPVQWLLRRDAVQALGGFPDAFEVMEDRAFLLNFVQHWRIAMLDRPLAFHHRRISRARDADRSAAMNTLDNPSYDWRRFADLALPATTAPAPGPTPGSTPGARPPASPPASPDASPDLPRLLRAVGASVLREVNAETSALWNKIDGEARDLRTRLDALEGRLTGTHAPEDPAPHGDDRPPGPTLWSLWEAVGPTPIGYELAPRRPFLDRLSLSMAGDDPGLWLHGDPHRRLLQLQIPRTGDWCALELSLDGLAIPGRGLACTLGLALPGGGLFQTGLMLRQGKRHTLAQGHVHAAPAGPPLGLTRTFPAPDLSAGSDPKFAIVLPRHAANLRLVLHDLTVRED